VTNEAPEFKQAEQEVKDRIAKILSIKGTRTVDELHRDLGLTIWNYCGMSRTKEGLEHAREHVKKLKNEFWTNVKVVGTNEEMNQTLEKALRLADFIELGALMIEDALDRNESCGGHFREEYQTPDGEAQRNDELYAYVAAWQYAGENAPEVLVKEPLVFENVKPSTRSYK
jgi:succinate dehydrogenase / fumarate reductase flavoprotein subunit